MMTLTKLRLQIATCSGMILLSIVAVPASKAACSSHDGGMFAAGSQSLQDLERLNPEGSFNPEGSLEQPALPEAHEEEGSSSNILGLWKKIYFAGGGLNDVGFAQFSAGGTELLNDTGALDSGNNFCIGAWKRVSVRTYELVHTFFVFDDSGKKVIGVAIEKSCITVARDGKTFRGLWTQDNFDLSGKVTDGHHFDGTIFGTRIAPGLRFPFPFPL